MNAAGDACSGLNQYGSNYDGVAQNWEIGAIASRSTFGSASPMPNFTPNLDNFAREYNRIWTAGIQQEIIPGNIGECASIGSGLTHNTW